MCTRVRTLFVLLAFVVPAFLCQTSHAAECKIAGPHPLTPAQTASIIGNYSVAESLYREEIVKTKDPVAIAGLIDVLLDEQKIDEAESTAKAALQNAPHSAPILTAMYRVQHRKGTPWDAQKTLTLAYMSDPCYPPAHLAMAHYFRFTSYWASAASELKLAHQLDPYDPNIRREWIQTLPIRQRIEELKKLIGDGSGDADSLRWMKHEVAVLEDHISQMENNQAGCHLVSEVTNTEIPFTPLMIDPTHISGWGLDVRFNDKNSHLTVDTGADGLYISRSVAERADLKPITTSDTGGIGDKGRQSGYTAFAKSIKIGSLEFQNCLVEVSDRRNVVGTDGLIGMDVFSNFLVTLDFPWHKMTLGPLPPYPDAPAATPASLNTQQESPAGGTETTASKDGKSDDEKAGDSKTTAAKRVVSSGPHNRYIAPEMQSWDRVYRQGHMLIVPVLLNAKTTRLFIVDTGAWRTSIAPWAAREVTKVHRDDRIQVKGVSGEVNEVFDADKITFRFSHFNQEFDDITSFAIPEISRNMNTEISGFIGFDILHFLVLKIDYRDGLMDFEYQADRGYQHIR
ncbi:aspartyl protease family protein [Silvibacterium acidisoli]|uniref:aspartyl protease family protein n=1 Tax=Acidobacteriaceae bacterium ZG23-2 TaxID=2883246 RepID=UPI00406BEBA9